MKMRSVARAGKLGVVAMLLVTAAACVSGPVNPPSDISLLIGPDAAALGYERSEFFLAGVANSYTPTAPLGTDGKWQVAPNPDPATRAPYRTRFVVYRPTDPAKFNGTVVVEWLNVTSGVDIPSDWLFAHNEYVRSGAAYVGVSAQLVGVTALKASGPRYASLVHPGDSHSYDIFTHAGQRVRDNPTVLGGLTPEVLIAAGESQSAGRLVTYVNAIHPLANVYDGFMVHSRGAGGSALTQAPLPTTSVPSPAPIRNDLADPVMVVQAEGDVINSIGVRQPDTPKFRLWELAGTSHFDAYTLTVSTIDVGDGSGAVAMFDRMRNPPDVGCGNKINAGPHHWLLQTAYSALDTWVRTGTGPAAGQPLVVASTGPTVLARDWVGNALGGVRTPHVDVPIATLQGTNTGPGFCRLFGSTIPFTTQQLAALYPTHEAFVTQYASALDDAVTNGFILPEDAPELLAAATASTIPN